MVAMELLDDIWGQIVIMGFYSCRGYHYWYSNISFSALFGLVKTSNMLLGHMGHVSCFFKQRVEFACAKDCLMP